MNSKRYRAGRPACQFNTIVTGEDAGAATSLKVSSAGVARMRYFLAHRGATLSREELLHEVWGYRNTPSTRTRPWRRARADRR